MRILNNHGQAVVETSFVLIYIAIILAGLIFFYEVFTEITHQNITVRTKMMEYYHQYDQKLFTEPALTDQTNTTQTNVSAVNFKLKNTYLFGDQYELNIAIQQNLKTHPIFDHYDSQTVSEPQYQSFLTQYQHTVDSTRNNIENILSAEQSRQTASDAAAAGQSTYISKQTRETYYGK